VSNVFHEPRVGVVFQVPEVMVGVDERRDGQLIPLSGLRSMRSC
jgi:hypothetical protein